MLTFEYLGKPMTHDKIVPGNTITSIVSECYTYTERYLAFTSGGTTAIVVGDWIVGATSSARARVLKVVVSTGTFAGGDAAGYLIINSQRGTFQSENIKVAAGTDDATIASDSRLALAGEYVNPEFKGAKAKAALVTAYAQTALCEVDGGKPDQSALVGVPLVAGSAWLLQDHDSIANFKCVDYTAASASTLQIKFYF